MKRFKSYQAGGTSGPGESAFTLIELIVIIGIIAIFWDVLIGRVRHVIEKSALNLASRKAGPVATFFFRMFYPSGICWPHFGMQMERDEFFNFPGSSRRGLALSQMGIAPYSAWKKVWIIQLNSGWVLCQKTVGDSRFQLPSLTRTL